MRRKVYATLWGVFAVLMFVLGLAMPPPPSEVWRACLLIVGVAIAFGMGFILAGGAET